MVECICDGSGWAEIAVMEGEIPRMVQCGACALLRMQKMLATKCGLIDSELDISLDDLVDNGPGTKLMKAMALRFQLEPWGMWTLWGTYGNGKTMVLQALTNYFRRQGHLAVYIRFKELLDWVRAGNSPDADVNAQDRYKRLVQTWFLAIDEMDKFYLTDYVEEFRLTFFDDRWRYGISRQRHTVIAMNDNPALLPGSIYDRLRDDRFGCSIGDEWVQAITENSDQSMRPLARSLSPTGRS